MIDMEKKRGREGDTLRPKSRAAPDRKQQRNRGISRTNAAQRARFVPVCAYDAASFRAKLLQEIPHD